MLAGSEAAGAEAVVFDVLFSDPDRSHPGGDKAFEAAVRKSSRSFFTVVRLPRANDAKSALFVHDVPGLALPGAGPERIVAVVLPFMQAILDTRRLGTSTVTPDEDGVLRSFAWAEPHDTWRLVSLPFAVAAGLGSSLVADTAAHLVVWRRTVDAYPRVSFVDVWRCAEGVQRERCPDLRGRIVVLGATAPSLHDVESTPLKANHAGVDILATLIDNALHGRQFIVVTPATRLALALAALATAAAIVALGRASSIRFATVALPAVLALVGYASLHSERVYFDLTIPAATALACFGDPDLRSASHPPISPAAGADARLLGRGLRRKRADRRAVPMASLRCRRGASLVGGGAGTGIREPPGVVLGAGRHRRPERSGSADQGVRQNRYRHLVPGLRSHRSISGLPVSHPGRTGTAAATGRSVAMIRNPLLGLVGAALLAAAATASLRKSGCSRTPSCAARRRRPHRSWLRGARDSACSLSSCARMGPGA